MANKPIAVLGGGNGGHVMAADLTLAGRMVNLYEIPSFASGFKATIERGSIRLQGVHRQGVAQLNKATTDIQEALEDVELVNVVTPATGHEPFFKEMIPFLSRGQVIIVWSGRFGSLVLAKMLREAGKASEVTVVEANTLPYGARMIGPAHVQHHLTARRVYVAALPTKKTENVCKLLNSLYEMVVPSKNVLEAAMSNSALITFPPVALLNTGRIEHSEGDFYAFNEGITKSVAHVIKGVYGEIFHTAKEWNVQIPKYSDTAFYTSASLEAIEFQAPTDTLAEFAKMRGPTSVPHRFYTENIGHGLVCISNLAQLVSVRTPIIDSIITLASVVCDEDYWTTGRTMEKLGLDNMDKAAILQYIE